MTEARHDMGVGGLCVCPKCGQKTEHLRGVPCQQQRCVVCDAKLLREGSHHHQLWLKKKASREQDKEDQK